MARFALSGPAGRQYAVFILALVLLAGCSGGGGEREATAPAATTEPTEETTTEAGPKPITPTERKWFRALNRYAKRFERQAFRSGQVTHASMRRDAKLARACRTTLLRGSRPGRFRPAAKLARRACTRLDKAARLLDRAIAASDPGGVVIAGTPEEKEFNRSYNGATEAMGNALYDLQRAQERARAIEVSLPNP